MSDQRLTYDQVVEELRRLGLRIESAPGEYRISFRRGHAEPYVTEDLADALAVGRQMAMAPPAEPLPPLGPVGRRCSRKGLMYRHNAKIAMQRLMAAYEVCAEVPTAGGSTDQTDRGTQ